MKRFTLIDPPQEPLEPISPNRAAILFLGFVFVLVSGFGCVFLGGTVITLVVAIISFHFLVMSLDVFWYKLIRVISNF